MTGAVFDLAALLAAGSQLVGRRPVVGPAGGPRGGAGRRGTRGGGRAAHAPRWRTGQDGAICAVSTRVLSARTWRRPQYDIRQLRCHKRPAKRGEEGARAAAAAAAAATSSSGQHKAEGCSIGALPPQSVARAHLRNRLPPAGWRSGRRAPVRRPRAPESCTAAAPSLWSPGHATGLGSRRRRLHFQCVVARLRHPRRCERPAANAAPPPPRHPRKRVPAPCADAAGRRARGACRARRCGAGVAAGDSDRAAHRSPSGRGNHHLREENEAASLGKISHRDNPNVHAALDETQPLCRAGAAPRTYKVAQRAGLVHAAPRRSGQALRGVGVHGHE
eukprot:140449-Chlamydomonas_euryale.AAC.4